MTFRSVLLGLLGAVVVNGFCFFNDWILRQTYLVGNNMPASIYGGLILVVLLLNPLLHKWRLRGRELAVILALTLAGAAVPGGGLVRTLVPTLVMPHHLVKTQPGWKSQGIVDEVPRRMLVNIDRQEDRVVNGYVQGLGEGDEHIGLREVPWQAWVRPLAYWLPIAMTLWIALIGLSVAMHRQWSQHEHLPYPIARFTDALLPSGDGRAGLLSERSFWVGLIVMLCIHLNNFAYMWFPEFLLQVPTRFDFTPLGKLMPLLVRGGGTGLLRPHIYIIIIGLSYFIPSDIAFSFGIGPFLWYLLVGVFAGYGVKLMSPVEGSSYFSLNPQSFALFGANIGVIAAAAYTGRHYYGAVLRGTFGGPHLPSVSREAVWGCRAFLVFTALLIGQFCLAGIDLWLAIPYTLFMVMGFVVLSRIIAETGLIYLKSYFWPCTILWGVLGARTLGTHQMLLMMLMTTVLFIDPREALMPFMANSLKVLELQKERIGRTSVLCGVALLIGLAVAVPVTLYIKYDMGSSTGDNWSTVTVPRVAYDNVVMVRQKLAAQGVTVANEPTGFLARVSAISATPLCLSMAFVGFVLVLVYSAARLRFTRWPIHPLMFVTWASTPLRWMGVSYLIGWGVKKIITQYGGSQAYNRLKPLMIGLIAGEVLGALFPTLFGVVYYFITNDQPKMFNVIPG
jgi:hypothetical protein